MPRTNRLPAYRASRPRISHSLVVPGGSNASRRPTSCVALSCVTRPLPGTDYCVLHQQLA